MLEVIACSVADARAAERGGADRLELVRDLDVGGLTPPPELVRDVFSAVRIPVRVMLREEESFFVQGEKKIERLCALARSLADLSVDGLVLGFLTGPETDPQIDHELLARVLACAPGVKATFHRAFESVRDSQQAVRELKRHPQIDHILTSGHHRDLAQAWPQRIEGLAELARVAAPEITILVGGGLQREMIGLLCQKATSCEFHVGTAARVPHSIAGAVCAEQVRELVRISRSGETERKREREKERRRDEIRELISPSLCLSFFPSKFHSRFAQ
jgi:copper homeostasis protein